MQGLQLKERYPGFLFAILILGITFMMLGNLGSGYVTAIDPQLENSPALELVEHIKSIPTKNSQIWVYNSGWPIKHMDFTYWYVSNNIHDMNYYTAYCLKNLTPIALTIGDTHYNVPDYIIDTQYLENGNQNIPESTFKIQNISVYKSENVLPTAFIVRNHQLVQLNVDKYASGEVIASGNMLKDDIVVLKTAYYPGWKINGMDATSRVNMVGTQLSAPTQKVSFVFDPLDYKIGAILSSCGILLFVILYLKRKELDEYLAKFSSSSLSANRKKGKRRTQ
jgi:hypothetical protein